MEKEQNTSNHAEEETMASQALSKADSAFKKIKNIVSSIAGIVISLLIIYAIYVAFIGNYTMDKFIDQVTFHDYSSLSLGSSLARFDSNGTWEFSVNSTKKVKIGKPGTATWSGHGDILREDGTIETVPISIEFRVFKEDKETTNIELDTCTIDGLTWSMDEDNALGAQNIFQVVMSDSPISTDLAMANATSFLGVEVISFAQTGYFSETTNVPSISTSDSYEDMYGDTTTTAPTEEQSNLNSTENEQQYKYDGMGFLCEFDNGSYNLITITVDTMISDPDNAYITILCCDSAGNELVNYGDWAVRLNTNQYQLNFENGGSLVIDMTDEYTANVTSMGLNGPVSFDGIYKIGY